jgi:hypothetical protein
MIRTTQTLCTLALAVGTASAGLSTTDPGLYTNIDDRAEARVRLDGGNSQTWKLAFWDADTTVAPFKTNGNADRDFFQNNQTYSFQLDYNVSTGQLDWAVGGLFISDTVLLDPGHALAGIKYFVTSDRDPGETRVDNMQVTMDGTTTESVASAVAGRGTSFFEPANLFFTSAVTTVRITGDINFNWDPGANLQGDRFRLTIKLNQGLIPTPGAAATLALAGLAAARRRR